MSEVKPRRKNVLYSIAINRSNQSNIHDIDGNKIDIIKAPFTEIIRDIMSQEVVYCFNGEYLIERGNTFLSLESREFVSEVINLIQNAPSMSRVAEMLGSWKILNKVPDISREYRHGLIMNGKKGYLDAEIGFIECDKVVPLYEVDNLKENETNILDQYDEIDRDQLIFALRKIFLPAVKADGELEKSFLVVRGISNTGKTFLIDKLIEFAGTFTSHTLDATGSLVNDKFRLSEVPDFNLTIIPEISARDFNVNANLWKRLTGEKYIQIEKKGIGKTTILNNARLLFTTNEDLYSNDEGESISKRAVILEFTKRRDNLNIKYKDEEIYGALWEIFTKDITEKAKKIKKYYEESSAKVLSGYFELYRSFADVFSNVMLEEGYSIETIDKGLIKTISEGVTKTMNGNAQVVLSKDVINYIKGINMTPKTKLFKKTTDQLEKIVQNLFKDHGIYGEVSTKIYRASYEGQSKKTCLVIQANYDSLIKIAKKMRKELK